MSAPSPFLAYRHMERCPHCGQPVVAEPPKDADGAICRTAKARLAEIFDGGREENYRLFAALFEPGQVVWTATRLARQFDVSPSALCGKMHAFDLPTWKFFLSGAIIARVAALLADPNVSMEKAWIDIGASSEPAGWRMFNRYYRRKVLNKPDAHLRDITPQQALARFLWPLRANAPQLRHVSLLPVTAPRRAA